MEVPDPGDQYNLKWNNHLANFIQTFIEHQHGEFLVDVTLSCEGKYIKTHKLILSACSDYFHSIFEVHGNLQHPVILLNGVKFNILKYILHFMYHGEVKVVEKDLPNVLALGETLQIKGLSSVKLRENIFPENVSFSTNQAPKRISRTEPYTKDRKRASTPPIQPAKVFSSETSHLTPHDFSRQKTPKVPSPNQTVQSSPRVPVVSSITTPKTVPGPPVISNSKTESPVSSTNSTSKPKEVKSPIPKPPHAFMIFANEWRKKLTIEHPEENNKEISVRLGTMWKNLLPETKKIYYREAKRAEDEHKLKYPEHVHPNDVKKKRDVNNSNLSATSVDPMEIVETQEQIAISDSE